MLMLRRMRKIAMDMFFGENKRNRRSPSKMLSTYSREEVVVVCRDFLVALNETYVRGRSNKTEFEAGCNEANVEYMSVTNVGPCKVSGKVKFSKEDIECATVIEATLQGLDAHCGGCKVVGVWCRHIVALALAVNFQEEKWAPEDQATYAVLWEAPREVRKKTKRNGGVVEEVIEKAYGWSLAKVVGLCPLQVQWYFQQGKGAKAVYTPQMLRGGEEGKGKRKKAKGVPHIEEVEQRMILTRKVTLDKGRLSKDDENAILALFQIWWDENCVGAC